VHDGVVSTAVRIGGAVRSSEGAGLERTMFFATGRRRVFEALLRAGMWWPHRVHHQSRVMLESRVGGRFFEDWGDGCGLLYGLLEVLAPPSHLCIRGPLILPEPLQAVWSLVLSEPEVRHTLVHASHSIVGIVDEATAESFARGWDDVYAALGGYLRHADVGQVER
jgi:hypothetical protein